MLDLLGRLLLCAAAISLATLGARAEPALPNIRSANPCRLLSPRHCFADDFRYAADDTYSIDSNFYEEVLMALPGDTPDASERSRWDLRHSRLRQRGMYGLVQGSSTCASLRSYGSLLRVLPSAHLNNDGEGLAASGGGDAFDYDVFVSFQHQGYEAPTRSAFGSVGVALRYVDEQNFVLWEWHNDMACMMLSAVVGGVRTAVESQDFAKYCDCAMADVMSGIVDVHLSVRGDAVEVSVNGTLALHATGVPLMAEATASTALYTSQTATVLFTRVAVVLRTQLSAFGAWAEMPTDVLQPCDGLHESECLATALADAGALTTAVGLVYDEGAPVRAVGDDEDAQLGKWRVGDSTLVQESDNDEEAGATCVSGRSSYALVPAARRVRGDRVVVSFDVTVRGSVWGFMWDYSERTFNWTGRRYRRFVWSKHDDCYGVATVSGSLENEGLPVGEKTGERDMEKTTTVTVHLGAGRAVVVAAGRVMGEVVYGSEGGGGASSALRGDIGFYCANGHCTFSNLVVFSGELLSLQAAQPTPAPVVALTTSTTVAATTSSTAPSRKRANDDADAPVDPDDMNEVSVVEQMVGWWEGTEKTNCNGQETNSTLLLHFSAFGTLRVLRKRSASTGVQETWFYWHSVTRTHESSNDHRVIYGEPHGGASAKCARLRLNTDASEVVIAVKSNSLTVSPAGDVAQGCGTIGAALTCDSSEARLDRIPLDGYSRLFPPTLTAEVSANGADADMHSGGNAVWRIGDQLKVRWRAENVRNDEDVRFVMGEEDVLGRERVRGTSRRNGAGEGEASFLIDDDMLVGPVQVAVVAQLKPADHDALDEPPTVTLDGSVTVFCRSPCERPGNGTADAVGKGSTCKTWCDDSDGCLSIQCAQETLACRTRTFGFTGLQCNAYSMDVPSVCVKGQQGCVSSRWSVCERFQVLGDVTGPSCKDSRCVKSFRCQKFDAFDRWDSADELCLRNTESRDCTGQLGVLYECDADGVCSRLPTNDTATHMHKRARSLVDSASASVAAPVKRDTLASSGGGGASVIARAAVRRDGKTTVQLGTAVSIEAGPGAILKSDSGAESAVLAVAQFDVTGGRLVGNYGFVTPLAFVELETANAGAAAASALFEPVTVCMKLTHSAAESDGALLALFDQKSLSWDMSTPGTLNGDRTRLCASTSSLTLMGFVKQGVVREPTTPAPAVSSTAAGDSTTSHHGLPPGPGALTTTFPPDSVDNVDPGKDPTRGGDGGGDGAVTAILVVCTLLCIGVCVFGLWWRRRHRPPRRAGGSTAMKVRQKREGAMRAGRKVIDRVTGGAGAKKRSSDIQGPGRGGSDQLLQRAEQQYMNGGAMDTEAVYIDQISASSSDDDLIV